MPWTPIVYGVDTTWVRVHPQTDYTDAAESRFVHDVDALSSEVEIGSQRHHPPPSTLPGQSQAHDRLQLPVGGEVPGRRARREPEPLQSSHERVAVDVVGAAPDALVLAQATVGEDEPRQTGHLHVLAVRGVAEPLGAGRCQAGGCGTRQGR